MKKERNVTNNILLFLFFVLFCSITGEKEDKCYAFYLVNYFNKGTCSLFTLFTFGYMQK
jgi:hypothetical protein